jgi:hypothetical protein
MNANMMPNHQFNKSVQQLDDELAQQQRLWPSQSANSTFINNTGYDISNSLNVNKTQTMIGHEFVALTSPFEHTPRQQQQQQQQNESIFSSNGHSLVLSSATLNTSVLNTPISTTSSSSLSPSNLPVSDMPSQGNKRLHLTNLPFIFTEENITEICKVKDVCLTRK